MHFEGRPHTLPRHQRAPTLLKVLVPVQSLLSLGRIVRCGAGGSGGVHVGLGRHSIGIVRGRVLGIRDLHARVGRRPVGGRRLAWPSRAHGAHGSRVRHLARGIGTLVHAAVRWHRRHLTVGTHGGHFALGAHGGHSTRRHVTVGTHGIHLTVRPHLLHGVPVVGVLLHHLGVVHGTHGRDLAVGPHCLHGRRGRVDRARGHAVDGGHGGLVVLGLHHLPVLDLATLLHDRAAGAAPPLEKTAAAIALGNAVLVLDAAAVAHAQETLNNPEQAPAAAAHERAIATARVIVGHGCEPAIRARGAATAVEALAAIAKATAQTVGPLAIFWVRHDGRRMFTLGKDVKRI